MKYTKGTEKLNLPDFFKFGIEIEAFNVQIDGENGLYHGASSEYIKSRNWHMATKREEVLVSKGGAELVSPILKDSPEDWQTIFEICKHIQNYPGKHGDKVVADEKCGLHIHFDANCLSQNPQLMKNFLRIYAESEELIFKMCNDINDPIRPSAINKNFRGLNLIYALWRNGMAAPTGKKILEQIENDTLKVSFKKFGRLKMLANNLKIDERRYAGLNLTNIGNPQKNTIEFRMSNGTLNPEIIKQNVFLYASVINTAIQATNNPEQYLSRLERFFKTDVTEEEKAHNFLNLIIDNDEDRKIYISRWQSVKDAPVFIKNYKKNFAQNRFQRQEFKEIYEKTPDIFIKKALSYIESILTPIKETGEIGYDR